MSWGGFIFDLLHELQKEANFSYNVTHEEDKWGVKNVTTGEWSGMIGNLINNKSDLAAQLFTDIATRREVYFWPNIAVIVFRNIDAHMLILGRGVNIALCQMICF